MSTRAALLLGLVLLVLLALAPVDLNDIGVPYPGLRRYGTYILTLWLVTAIAAMGVNLIVGYAGQETLAQAAFVGIGAYLTAIVTKAGVPFGVAFAASGLLTFVIGIALGFPALRVQKHYLAFVTLAFSVLCWLVFRNEQWITGGVMGIRDIERPSLLGLSLRNHVRFYWFVLGDHLDHDLRAVVDRALAVGPRLHRAAREPAARREPRRRRPALHAARLRPGLGLWRHGGQPLCAAGRVHRPQPVRARPLAALHADGGDRRQRHLPRARSSAPASPCCCPNGCAPGRPTTC